MNIFAYVRQAKWDRDPSTYINSLVSRTPPYSYLQFSDIIKLGINPSTRYDTPVGIYAYPLVPSIKQKLFRGNIPFASDRKYIIFFKSRIDSNVLYSSRANNIGYKRLRAKLISRAFDKEWDRSLNDTPEERLLAVKRWGAQAKYKTDLGKLWNVTRMLAGKKIMPWTSILLRLGVDGVVDDADVGIIHPNEPTQAIFFLKASIAQKGTFPNIFTREYLHSPKRLKGLLLKGGGEIEGEYITCDEMNIREVKNAFCTLCTFVANRKVFINDSVFTKCRISADYGSKFVKSNFVACTWELVSNANVILENCRFEQCSLSFISRSNFLAINFKNVFMDDESKKSFFKGVPEELINKFLVDGNLVSTVK